MIVSYYLFALTLLGLYRKCCTALPTNIISSLNKATSSQLNKPFISELHLPKCSSLSCSYQSESKGDSDVAQIESDWAFIDDFYLITTKQDVCNYMLFVISSKYFDFFYVG